MECFSDDLMNKVMQRHVGGVDCESSVKHLSEVNSGKLSGEVNLKWNETNETDSLECPPNQRSVDASTDIVINEESIEKSAGVNNSELALASRNQTVTEILNFDEIDGTGFDSVEVCRETVYSASKLSGKFPVHADAYGGIEDEQKMECGEELIGKEGQSHCRDSKNMQPRIEMFSDFDSSSDSNPFMLESFQSLNESIDSEKDESSIGVQKGADRNEITVKANDVYPCYPDTFEKSEKLTVENEEESDCSESSSTVRSRVDDTGDDFDESSGERMRKSQRQNEGSGDIEEKSNGDVKNRSGIEDSENSDEFSTLASMHARNEPKEKLNLDIIQGTTTAQSDAKLSHKMSQKKPSECKKSRKQNAPKRILKDGDDTEFPVAESSLEPNADENTDKKFKYLKGAENIDFQKLLKEDGVDTPADKVSEKSRKQSRPMKIYHADSNFLEFEHFDEREVETGKAYRRGYREEGTGVAEENIDMDEETISKMSNNHESSNQNFSQNNNEENNAAEFFGQNVCTPQIDFSQDLKFLARYRQGLEASDSAVNVSPFLLHERSPENLDMIRQLREIRCNRYRKISIAEKREIAGYASVHGVSKAAAHYNVSKSAVSMWTKLDFSKLEEDLEKKQKNVFAGNEKFEALVQRVKVEKETKFKHMSKQDKFEVSRYAKLIGVREMSRCLDVALGTVSGWMRQFPYKVETLSSDPKANDDSNTNSQSDGDTNSQFADESRYSESKGSFAGDTSFDSSLNTPFKRELTEVVGESDVSPKRRKLETPTVDAAKSYRTVQDDNAMFILPAGETEEQDSQDGTTDEETTMGANLDDSQDALAQPKDELDEMIAETLQKPDIEKCYEDIKELIKDSPLEGDDYFRDLFERVVACRADKYKSLKPNEKLEVVRYAKRIGVRRIAKIMGLATGTLSGWNMKYQSCLGLIDPNLEQPSQSETLLSSLSQDSSVTSDVNNSQESIQSPLYSSPLESAESSEVREVKLLYKDRFPVMLKKIEEAKQMKFRNITKDEKIEFVKCSKLVGIRPTGRVFGIPIGTLSGWITKYSKFLHPAYNVGGESEFTCFMNGAGIGNTSLPNMSILNARANMSSLPPLPNLTGMMGPVHIAPHLAPYFTSVPGFGINSGSPIPNFLPSSSLAGLSAFASPRWPMSLPNISKQLFKDDDNSANKTLDSSSNEADTKSGKEADTIQRQISEDSSKLEKSVNQAKDSLADENSTDKSSLGSDVKSKPITPASQHTFSGLNLDAFNDEDAKKMAQDYLKNIYQQMGIQT